MTCRGCGGSRLSTVFAMAPLPLVGAIAETAQAAIEAERFPLEWRFCERCGLVNVWPDIPGEAIFAHYSYRASDVPALARHHRDLAAYLVRSYQPRLHVEIGGNDGVLLRHLPWPTVNVDPSDVANGDIVLREPFTSALVRRMGWEGQVDLVTSSNAFAHFAGIADAMDGVRLALSRNGHFIVEVHDLSATIIRRQWDTIYHEHAVEWSAGAMQHVAALHGMDHVSTLRLPLHGGAFRSTFRKGDGVRPFHRYDFEALQRAYDEAKPPPLPDGSVAYGAGGRATVYLDHVRPNVVAVIDGSPRRAGGYVPGVGLPILPPSDFDAPPAALITAWPHAEDIKARHPGYTRWLTAWS